MRRVSQTLISVLLALVFMYAGLMKALDTPSFYRDIGDYHLLTDPTAWWVAHYLPWLEIVASVGLLIGSCRGPACVIILSLLLVFSGAVLSAWLRGLNIECGCFGAKGDVSNYAWILARDALLLGAAVYVLQSEIGRSRNSVVAELASA